MTDHIVKVTTSNGHTATLAKSNGEPTAVINRILGTSIANEWWPVTTSGAYIRGSHITRATIETDDEDA